MRPLRVALFASGTGSNAMALVAMSRLLPQVEISFVLSDKSQAPVLAKAQAENVKTYLVEKTSDKESHEGTILQLLKEHHVDWIFLAGYMRLLSASFIREFSRWHGGAEQIVNIHPSILPAYPGVNSIERAFNDKVSASGVTLHLVDEGMDTGRILDQKTVPLDSSEDLKSWAQKIHFVEHGVYASFLQKVASGVHPTVPFQET